MRLKNGIICQENKAKQLCALIKSPSKEAGFDWGCFSHSLSLGGVESSSSQHPGFLLPLTHLISKEILGGNPQLDPCSHLQKDPCAAFLQSTNGKRNPWAAVTSMGASPDVPPPAGHPPLPPGCLFFGGTSLATVPTAVTTRPQLLPLLPRALPVGLSSGEEILQHSLVHTQEKSSQS